jgi:hypothetical protein
MLLKSLSATLVALTLGVFAAPASAAPSGLDGLKKEAVPSAEQVAQRCWYHRGHRHCRHVERHGYGPSINLYLGDRRHGHRRHHRRDHQHR